MTVSGMAAGWRFAIAALAAAGAAFFAMFAIAQPLWFLSSGAPVEPHFAALAWAACLAGLPMGALAFFAAAVAMRSSPGPAEWEVLARRCLAMGLCGLGISAMFAAMSLGLALVLNGRPSVYMSGDGAIVPTIAILAGLAIVVAVNLVRLQDGSVWTACGHIIWGFFGVVALTIGVPMAGEAAAIEDLRTLSHRYNLLIVFYPVLWLGFAAIAGGIVICGLRWVLFSLSAHQRSDVSPPSTGKTWPVTYDDSADIKNKAA
jgi:hypothetical protein